MITCASLYFKCLYRAQIQAVIDEWAVFWLDKKYPSRKHIGAESKQPNRWVVLILICRLSIDQCMEFIA